MRGALGRISRVGPSAVISISTSISYAPRRRWTIAHELGHLELHKTGSQLELCKDADISENYDAGTEREANAFASEFLMPSTLWSKCVDVAEPNLDIVGTLAKEFEVSFTAAAIRFVKLCPECCCVVFAKEGKIEWFARGSDFDYQMQQGTKLDPYTLAFDYFKKGTVTTRPETVSASAWLSDKYVKADDELVEHCRILPHLGATLSLLWVPP
ncbi:conserved uncharacterized protein [Stigmatella aurantiaca DW4/3-1]|uniref:Conserved uncharacterized protein n=2 Tax=Stigmatella aurantiaca TaxID=41 RepID=E3G0G6_STIAD|nr:conserved uncharacterized protein [Stigmatella aurantiaca DW4/3-1]